MNSDTNVIDVESRIVEHTAAASAAGPTTAQAATPAAPDVAPTELSLVPALVAKTEIVKANPALTLMQQLIARIALELPTIDVTTTKGEKRARELRAECVQLRTSTDKAYKAWNKPILEAQRGIRAVVEQVAEGITPAESQLDKMIQDIEAARERKKAAEIEAEQKRVDALREKITSTFVNVPLAAVKMTSAEIDAKVRELQDLPITDAEDSFGEFSLEADGLRARIISELLDLGRTKKAQEDEAVRLEAQREEQLATERRLTAERALQAKVDAIKAKAFDAFGKTAAQIKAVHDQLQGMEPLALEFGEMYGAASATWQQTLHMVANAMNAQASLEAQQSEAARQQAELDRQAEERAAAERKAAADKAAAERAATERAQRIESRMTNLRLNGEHLESLSCETLVTVIDRVNKLAIDADSFGERLEEAETVRTTVLAKLGDAYTEAFQAQKRRAEEQEQREERARLEAAEQEAAEARALDSEADNFDDIAKSIVDILRDADYPSEFADATLVVKVLTDGRVQNALRTLAAKEHA